MNDQTDAVVVAHALRMWANWIETGDPVLSSGDAVNSGQQNLLQSLNRDQHEMIARLHKLADQAECRWVNRPRGQ